MISIAIVIFREILEIALIVGVLLAATQGLQKRGPWVCLGLLGGIAGACVIAIFAEAISSMFEGMGQEVVNAGILLCAASLIGWTVIWMSKHARQINQDFRLLGQHVLCGVKPIHTLAVVVCLSVLREGAEIVMFVYSALVTGTKVTALVSGGLLGASAGAALGVAIYYGLMKVPMRQIFAVTSGLLVFLVAGMVAQAVGLLVASGRMPELIPVVWDSNWIIAQESFLGRILHILIGYTARPSGIQVIMYILTIGGLWFMLKYSSQVKQGFKAIVMIGALSVSLLGFPGNGQAAKQVYNPYVVRGEREIEIQGRYDYDKRDGVDKKQVEKWALGYGVNDWWQTELVGEIEKARSDEQFKFTALEWENKFQLAPQGKYVIDPGFLFEYEGSFENRHPGEFTLGPLFTKQIGKFMHTTNWLFKKEVGGGAMEEWESEARWQTKYQFKQYFEPGVEYYAGFNRLRSNHNTFNDQQHQVGPVFYGKVGKVRYDIGYLFGISNAAQDGMLKWVLEYEF